MSNGSALQLEALGCPHQVPKDFHNQWKDVQAILLWLEDMKIRQLDIPEREPLRSAPSKKKFLEEWASYMQELGYPYSFDAESSDRAMIAALEWVIGLSLQLDYEDNTVQISSWFREHQRTNRTEKKRQRVYRSPELRGGAAPSKVDVDAVRSELSRACTILKLPSPADSESLEHLVTRVQRAVFALTEGNSAHKSLGDPKAPLPPPGFSTGDELVDRAASVLRLLYVADLRHLQTALDRVIAEAQELTARPKTDAKLGKVGF